MSGGPARPNLAARAVASPAFTSVVVGTILVNAVVLGLQSWIDQRIAILRRAPWISRCSSPSRASRLTGGASPKS